MTHLTDEILNEYLDGELNAAQRIEADAHLADCTECAARLANLRVLFNEIASLPDLELPRDLSASVLQKVTPPPTAMTPSWIPALILLQALLALIASFFAASLIQKIPSISLPAYSFPTSTELLTRLDKIILTVQSQWTQIHWPSISLNLFTSLDLSSVFIIATLISALLFWLIGNGLLLRSQSHS